ncbi:Tfp pilus assembly protein FimT/FimU [Succinimonas sp.]|uniref:Tfp pilus assembly protein FimT/FimU n=1 Tax=Succinimonas sp. TaxID=1936151 RepID=UPI003868CF0F
MKYSNISESNISGQEVIMRSLRARGFTLIELVVVIVILGILAATAAPKFMDLQRDARISKLNGLKAAIRSAENMTRSKAVIAGLERYPALTGSTVYYVCLNDAATVKCNSTNGVSVSYGYPAALNSEITTGLLRALDIDAVPSGDTNRKQHDWQYKSHLWESGITQLLIGPSDMELPDQYQDDKIDSTSKGCYIVYDNPYMQGDKLMRMAQIVDTGC